MKANKSDMPILLVDTREQRPLRFSHLPAESATLYTGDYSVKGLEECFAVERKSLADLAGSLTRDRKRFERELQRLRGYHFPYLLVIGNEGELRRLVTTGRMNLNQAEHSLRAIQARYRVHVARADNEEQAARLVETWAFCAWREMLKPAGASFPFPDWIEGILCRRIGRPTLAGHIMEGVVDESGCS